MSGELKRAFYRIFIMIIALFFKILIIQDVFMFLTRLVFGYNDFSSVLYIVLAAATVGIAVGEAMVAKEKNDPKARRAAVEYFTKHTLTRKECARYMFKVNGETMDFVMYGVLLLLLLVAIFTVRMITTDWMFIFEAMISFVVILGVTILTELLEKYRLYYELTHRDEFVDF